MAEKVSYVKTTLSYPIFAAEFDPYNRGYLVVGGGGGEGRSGVPNQITLLDVSNRGTIQTAAEIELSKDEDSVQSLASLGTKDGLITYAGINSSRADQDNGKNAHFRSFEIKYPPRKKQRTEKDDAENQKGSIKPLGQSSLFRPPKPKSEVWQRLLRLSPAKITDGGGKRLGAIATGLAKDSEVVVFNATAATPGKDDIVTRIDLPEKSEAADLDILETDEGSFSVIYCTDYEIYEQTVEYDFKTKKAKLTPKGPRRVHQMPFPDTFSDPKSRSKFRCIRFLDAENIITLANRANKAGCELQVFHLYPTGPANHLEHLQKKLPSRVKAATSLDVCPLDADVRTRDRQIAVAVAGQDISIEVYALDYLSKTSSFSGFKKVTSLRDIGHPQQMTKILFSPFHSPVRKDVGASSGNDGKAASPKASKHPGPQYLRLASVSYGNTVVIDTFALMPLEPKNANTRYMLHHPSQARREKLVWSALILLFTVVTALLAQSYFYPSETGVGGNLLERVLTPEVQAYIEPIAAKFAPKHARDEVAAAAAQGAAGASSVLSAASSSVSSAVPSAGRLKRLLQYHAAHPKRDEQAVVIKGTDEPHGVDIDVAPNKEEYVQQDVDAKHWDELNEESKHVWRERLIRAGEWVEGEAETVLKGILFSEYAGFVAQAVQ